MTRKVYRTAQGKTVDLGALQLQNENVRAVGNMGVNARGDLIDGFNRAIESKNTSVKKNYHRQMGKTSNVTNTSVTKPAQAQPKKTKTPKAPAVHVPETEQPQEQPQPQAAASTAPAENTSNGGLAAAIAKARTLREQPIMRHKDMVRDQPGVTKI